MGYYDADRQLLGNNRPRKKEPKLSVVVCDSGVQKIYHIFTSHCRLEAFPFQARNLNVTKTVTTCYLLFPKSSNSVFK